MDGARLAAVIRDRWPPIHIVVTSGFINSRDLTLPERSVFVPKPYDVDDLIDTFHALLR